MSNSVESKKEERKALYGIVKYHTNDIVKDKYRIVKKIGEGGYGNVFLGENIKSSQNDFINAQDKLVAIKVINRSEVDEDEWRRFNDECVTNLRVSNHKNLVNTYCVDLINNQNSIVIIMEYIDGIDLRRKLEQVDHFSVKDAIRYFDKILIGIKELHSFKQKIIHRDLKPDNILITKDLHDIKIIDFGISSVYNENKEFLTDETLIAGSFEYMCPEVRKIVGGPHKDEMKKQVINEQFDFFALGIIFYKMLTGTLPFKHEDGDSWQKIIEKPLIFDMPCISDINPDIPVEIENIIYRCIASKPNEQKYHYQNVNDIIDDLQSYKNSHGKNSVAKLLLPKNGRNLQTSTFRVEKEKNKEKIYEANWFYLTILSVAIVILILVIVLSLLHELSV